MVKCFPLLMVLLYPVLGKSQGTALLLKKHDKTVERFYPGKFIVFTTTDGMPVNGELKTLTKDSIFITYYQVAHLRNQFGGAVHDTTGRFLLSFSLANIGSFPRHRSNLLGTALILGGLGYTGANLVNTVREKEPPFGKDNLPRLAAGLGAAAAGVLINKSKKRTYDIGHTYHLEVVE